MIPQSVIIKLHLELIETRARSMGVVVRDIQHVAQDFVINTKLLQPFPAQGEKK